MKRELTDRRQRCLKLLGQQVDDETLALMRMLIYIAAETEELGLKETTEKVFEVFEYLILERLGNNQMHAEKNDRQEMLLT